MAHPRTQRSRFGIPVGDEPVLDGPWDRLLQHPLHRSEQVGLVDAHERDRRAGRAGPSGSSDPVDVVLRIPRELEVDDDRQVLDVESARSDVRRDQDPDVTAS